MNSSIFFTAYKQYTIELYPTLMRAIAVGTFGGRFPSLTKFSLTLCCLTKISLVVERIGGAVSLGCR